MRKMFSNVPGCGRKSDQTFNCVKMTSTLYVVLNPVAASFQFENPRVTLLMNTIIDQQPTSVCSRVLSKAASGLELIGLRVNAFTHR